MVQISFKKNMEFVIVAFHVSVLPINNAYVVACDENYKRIVCVPSSRIGAKRIH